MTPIRSKMPCAHISRALRPPRHNRWNLKALNLFTGTDLLVPSSEPHQLANLHLAHVFDDDERLHVKRFAVGAAALAATQHSLGVLWISNTCCTTEAGPTIVHMDRMPCNKRCAKDDFNRQLHVRRICVAAAVCETLGKGQQNAWFP